MFQKVLIANRGEIAVRVARTLQQLGVRAAAVYSDADSGALHVSEADEAYPLPGVTSAETYLRGDVILDIAERHDVDAIHPGYGFLSENAEFAEACAAAGIVFIGPGPEAIRSMGDKVTARRIMEEAGVPVVPGWSSDGDLDVAELERQVERIGYPVLLKAAAGGGGRGMRVVEQLSSLASSVDSAQREAAAAFGDGRLFVEKYLPRARHVEFQVFGDAHGNVVHLYERECSIQRRHQKIIEESPSPGLTDDLRQKMGDAAVRAARAAGYTNAGTVEFMTDDAGAFYFLEMNTRLQVEHPVTEMILGRDLVADQLRVAAGEPLPFKQEDLRPSGHAVECRIYAEDPGREFLPATGTIDVFAPPAGPNIRVDSGIASGSEVSIHYDPMLAKLIAWGPTRAESLNRIEYALRHFAVLGVTTNIEFLHRVIEHDAFRAGALHTHFLDEHALATPDSDPPPLEALVVAAALATGAVTGSSTRRHGAARDASGDRSGPWRSGGSWRNL